MTRGSAGWWVKHQWGLRSLRGWTDLGSVLHEGHRKRQAEMPSGCGKATFSNFGERAAVGAVVQQLPFAWRSSAT